MKCHVCGETDTSGNPCACIVCDECAKKTHDNDLVVGKHPDEGMYCSAECASRALLAYIISTVTS
jgi:hypothetical protein